LPEPLVGALNVAAAKARAVRGAADEVILAADTLVVADGRILGKPADVDAARGMLGQLRGRSHLVMSGVALRSPEGMQWGGVVSTRVAIRAYVDAEVEAYIGRGEPFDKAGGYAIQDEAFRPVDGLAGCYLNVVGLPLCAVAAGLDALGIDHAAGPAPERGRPPCGLCRAGAPLVSIRSAY
jgi:MAF protein